jgi:pyrroloquinoline quinone (PQQ) biosynthesis protein C
VVTAGDELDLEALLARVRAPWGSASTDADVVSAAAIASAELARRACADRGSRRAAETLLYLLNAAGCFAAPVDPVVGVVWTTLMAAKWSELRRELGAAVHACNRDEMRQQLVAVVKRWGAFRHPLLDDLERLGTVEPYRVWAKNWFGSCYGFSVQLTGLLQRQHAPRAKKIILENLNEELDARATHDDVRLRFYAGLGLSHSYADAIRDPDWVLESTELLNLRTGLCTLPDPIPALGCFYGIEANWALECHRHHAMNQRRGLDDHALEYWKMHIVADEHHAGEWLDVVDATCETDAQRATVVEGALVQLRLRWRMYDAIREQVAAG